VVSIPVKLDDKEFATESSNTNILDLQLNGEPNTPPVDNDAAEPEIERQQTNTQQSEQSGQREMDADILQG